MRERCCLWLLSVLTTPLWAASAPLSLQGPGPYYRVVLPLALYPQTAAPDLGDVHVLNGRGQAVPFAWANPPATPELQWSEPIAPSHCEATFCDYPMPAHTAVTQLDLVLKEPNTVMPIEVLVKRSAPVVRHHRHHHLNNLLRHKGHYHDDDDEPVSSPSQPTWQVLAQGQAHWLRTPSGDTHSMPIELHQTYREPQLRIRAASAQLVSAQLRVATPQRSLIFLAQGPTPYTLRWGTLPNPQGAWRLTDLLPQSSVAPESLATVSWAERTQEPGPIVVPAPVVQPALTATQQASTAATASPPASPSKKYLLWLALATGLGLLSWMAWTVLGHKKNETP